MGEDVLFPLKARQVDTGFGNPAPVGDLFMRKGIPHWRYPDGTVIPVISGGAPTAPELRNEAREALTKALAFRDEGKKDEFDKAWADYQEKDKAADVAETEEATIKAATEKHQPAAHEIRDDRGALAGPVQTLRPEDAKDGVMLLNGKGGYEVVQLATKETEGWIKGFPAACQPVELMRRFTPELVLEAACYKGAFNKWLRRGKLGMDAKELKALEAGVDAEGGYLVPEDQRRASVILDLGAPGGSIRPLSTVITTSRDAGDIPTAGGVSFTVIGEEVAIAGADTDPTFGQFAFTIFKPMALTKVANELLEDSAAPLAAILGQLYSDAQGQYEDQQAIEGDGTTEAEGLRQATITDSVGDYNASTGPDWNDVTEHYTDMPARHREGATWHITSSFLRRLLDITGAGIPRVVEFMGDPIRPVILGHPVRMFDGTGWDDAGTIATDEEFGCFGNFRAGYYFVDRVGMTIKRLDELYAGNDQTGFVARYRYFSGVACTGAFRSLKAANA